LAEAGWAVDHETLRRWLLMAKKWERQRRRGPHRERRERRAHFGELVQMDGSHHRWFGPDHPKACLMVLVDDAQGTTWAWMAEEETTEAAMRGAWQWCERYGIPRALYADRKNVFVTPREPTIEEQLAGEVPRTEFGRACAKLDIEIISAHSPQAKGRVERKHAVFQDRFVKELRLRGITTIEGANALLAGGFLDELNRKFSCPAREVNDFHRPLPPGLDLGAVFCFEETRTVGNDWTVRWHNRWFQIRGDSRPLPKPKEKAVVRLRLDGKIELLYRNAPLRWVELAAAPAPPPAPPKAPCVPSTPSKPAWGHPWRRGGAL
jgi:hypothetical protein